MESVRWGSERQRYAYKLGSGKGPWLVVIHGGAWRDPRTTDLTAEHLVRCVEAAHPHKFGGFASLDYRLSPAVVHPAHVEDALEGIRQLQARFRVESMVLCGHSCGAFMAGQLTSVLGSAVERLVTLEGIYGLHEMVDEYPAYESFVREAFGDDWPRVDWRAAPPITVIHSREDELLSLNQPQWLAGERRVEMVTLERGKHDEVFEQLDLGSYF